MQTTAMLSMQPRVAPKAQFGFGSSVRGVRGQCTLKSAYLVARTSSRHFRTEKACRMRHFFAKLTVINM